MNKHIIVIGTVTLLLFVGLSGCLSNEEQRFIGTWQNDMVHEQIYAFKSDFLSKSLEIIVGTGFLVSGETVTGDWRVDGNKLILTLNLEQPSTFTYYYRFEDDDTLVLSTKGTTFTANGQKKDERTYFTIDITLIRI